MTTYVVRVGVRADPDLLLQEPLFPSKSEALGLYREIIEWGARVYLPGGHEGTVRVACVPWDYCPSRGFYVQLLKLTTAEFRPLRHRTTWCDPSLTRGGDTLDGVMAEMTRRDP